MAETKEVAEHIRETAGGDEAAPEDIKVKGEQPKTDASLPEKTQQKQKAMQQHQDQPDMQQPTGKLSYPDEQFTPARNDPYHSATPLVNIDPTDASLDRDQSLGFTTEGPTEQYAQNQTSHIPDAPHQEPSTFTPSGARPGQQNPVNPQGSPGTDAQSEAVGARPLEPRVVIEGGRAGDYTKVITPGEKNPSQLGVEIDHQPYFVETRVWDKNANEVADDRESDKP